ncbi:MAG TPA: elongation factor Ts [Firmicutes bacterium]|nr:elongation factor Ts [Bacillota bacterium]
MAISASTVKELRERTGAGMMDCKKALTEADGDIEKAIEILREKGLAAAAKKASRIAAEGLVGSNISKDGRSGALIEVNCETDFVAKTDDFKAFVTDLAAHIVASAPQGLSPEEAGAQSPYLLEQSFKDGKTVKDYITQMVANIGENISVRRFTRFEVTGDGLVQDYIHMGGKIGVLLELAFDRADLATNEEVHALAKDLTMQVAAAKPEYVRRTEVPADAVEKEKAIYKAQAMNEGKPENIAEKITLGRIEKFFREICLEEQEFIKDNDLTVGKVVSQLAQKLGADIKIVRFVRYEKGEGLQKREDDFVSEVMSQIKS